MHLKIYRPMWGEFFTIELENGHTEELEPEEARKWLKERGAEDEKIQKVLDYVWNFQYVEADIENYKEPPVSRLPHSPDI